MVTAYCAIAPHRSFVLSSRVRFDPPVAPRRKYVAYGRRFTVRRMMSLKIDPRRIHRHGALKADLYWFCYAKQVMN